MSMSWREMKETDAIPQRQAVPLRPIARERGWPSLTRTDIKEGKWGNCYNKSSMCPFPDFLRSARGAGCMEQLCFCLALAQSLKGVSAAAYTLQLGTEGKRTFHHGRNLKTGSPFFLCFPPCCMLVTCKGDADAKVAQVAEEPQAHPWAGDGDPGPPPHPQNCFFYLTLWRAIFAVTLGFTSTIYIPYLK